MAYQEIFSNSSTLSIGYKDLKTKFSKLSKEDLSKVNTSKVNKQLQKEVINLRHSLAKFVNGYENLQKFGHLSCDCIDHPKGLSKLSRTNKKGLNRIWIHKNMIIPIVDLLDSKKKTNHGT
ncbi:hypothetical protein CR513_36728, partial [Mucuna pruriens]